MISGLRQLPRVQADRSKQRDAGAGSIADDFMDCTACKASPDHESFAPEWRCGWLAPEDHREGGTCPHSEDVCPGYSIQLPEVIEAARLYQWREKGSLAALVELPLPQIASTAIDVLGGAVGEIEREMLADAKKARA